MKSKRLNTEITAADALTDILLDMLNKLDEYTDAIETENAKRSDKARAKAEQLREQQKALWRACGQYRAKLHHQDLRA